jgi:hypothetical protein
MKGTALYISVRDGGGGVSPGTLFQPLEMHEKMNIHRREDQILKTTFTAWREARIHS